MGLEANPSAASGGKSESGRLRRSLREQAEEKEPQFEMNRFETNGSERNLLQSHLSAAPSIQVKS